MPTTRKPKTPMLTQIIELPSHLQFLVVDGRPGRGTYHKMHKVTRLGLDQIGGVAWLVLAEDSSSLEPAKRYSTLKVRP